MQRDYKVLLVEDDRDLCEEFVRCFAATEGLELVATTDSATKALEYLRELQPDAVILDLELHMGEGNGITFLSQMGRIKGIKKPFVLVNTNNSSLVTYNVVRNLGADFVMYKHQQGHRPSDVTDVLLAVAARGADVERQPFPQQTDEHQSTQDRAELRARILEELNKVAISPKSKGYNYLTDAIEIICGGQLPNVSAMIGKKYGKTEKSVERAMQNAIDRAWDSADINDLLQHYTGHISSKRISPTVTEFICYYAAKLKTDSQEK